MIENIMFYNFSFPTNKEKLLIFIILIAYVSFGQNNPPTFASTPATTTLNDGDIFSYTIDVNDPDSDFVTLNPLTKPSWLNLTNLGDLSSFSLQINAISSTPYDVVVDSSGNMFVADISNHHIKKITPNGVVTVFAGGYSLGFQDGVGTAARFGFPQSIAIDSSDNIYVAGAYRVRKITPAGVVTTLAINNTQSAQSITVDNAGFVYVTNTTDKKIYSIEPNGYRNDIYDGSIYDRFGSAQGLAVDSDGYQGYIYVADVSKNQILKVHRVFNSYSVFAGSGNDATVDGVGTSASFSSPIDVEIDAVGNLYVTCLGDHNIRKITPSGVVTTIAGSLDGVSGSVDNNGLLARFNQPRGLALDASGNVYVADTQNKLIRKVDAYVLSGDTSGNAGMHDVILEATDGKGGSTQQSFTISVLITPTVVSYAATDVSSFGATFNGNVTANGGATVTERGFIYSKTSEDSTPTLAEVNGSSVKKEVVTGTLGSFNKDISNLIKDTEYSYVAYATNSVGTAESTIQTFTPVNVAPTFTSTPIEKISDSDSYVYNISANDKDNDGIVITAPTIPSWISLSELQNVTTYAGSGANGYQDINGAALSSKFNYPSGVALDPFGNVYVADGGYRIRKISTDGIVSTYAGTGSYGSTDGYRTSATFTAIFDVVVDVLGNVYLTDTFNHTIRKIDTNGNVSTLAGSGARGKDDGEGTSASFDYPSVITVDATGNLFVAGLYNNIIRKITPSGTVTTIAGSGTAGSNDGIGVLASFRDPTGIAVDASGNLYIADSGNNKIRKILTDGTVSTIAGSGIAGDLDGTALSASFNYPFGISIDGLGNIYVTDRSNNKIRKIDINSGVVTTIAGSGVTGDNDDVGLLATFNSPRGITVDALGENIYVADQNNHKIRKMSVSYGLTGNPANNEGEHPVVIEASDGTATNQQNFTITVNKNNTFTTTGNWSETAKWSSGLPATDFTNVTVADGVTITMDTDDLTVNDLTLNSGATINIPKDKEITINGNFNTSGSLLLGSDKDNSGVLFVKGTTSGTVTYKRGGLLANKWSIVTPPVSGQKILSFAQDLNNDIRTNTTVSPIRYAIGVYDDSEAAGNKWGYYTADTPANDEFIAGESYTMSRNTDGEVSFTGTLNVNTISKTLPTDGWSAIGNPFTTYLAANKNSSSSFLNDNFSKLDDNFKSIYVWDNTQNKYIAISEVDATHKSLTPGQGFFIRLKVGESTISFNEDKRQLKPISGNSGFAKNSNTTPEIILKISDNSTTVNTSIKYFDEATNGFDPGYDIGNFNGASLDVFTHLLEDGNGVNYTIQSLPKNNYDNQVIPIGINAGSEKEITFTTDAMNLPSDIKIFLEDRETNTFIHLDEANSNYKTTLTSNSNGIGRFYLHTTTSSLSVHTDSALENISIYKLDKSTIRITGISQEKTDVSIFNLLGKQVFNSSFTANRIKDIVLPDALKGVYVVQLKFEKNKFSRKIILE